MAEHNWTDEQISAAAEGIRPEGLSEADYAEIRKYCKEIGIEVKRTRKWSQDDLKAIAKGVKPDGMTEKKYVYARSFCRKLGMDVSKPKNDPIKITKEQEDLCARGIVPTGWTAKRFYSVRNRLSRKGVPMSPLMPKARVKKYEFNPADDLLVMQGGCPDGATDLQAARRREYLKLNFVDVGWGDLIGKQVIHEI